MGREHNLTGARGTECPGSEMTVLAVEADDRAVEADEPDPADPADDNCTQILTLKACADGLRINRRRYTLLRSKRGSEDRRKRQGARSTKPSMPLTMGEIVCALPHYAGLEPSHSMHGRRTHS